MITRSVISKVKYLKHNVANKHYYLIDYHNNQKGVINLKYHLNLSTIKSIIEKLSDLMPEQLYEDYPLESDWLIVPVPLFWLTRFKRRFDLNRIIAKKLARKINNLNYLDVIKNIKPTRQGDYKTKSSRVKNAKDKFKIRNKYLTRINQANVVIFDDVVASGSTMKAVEKTLRTNGAKNVIWLSIAH